MIKYNNYNYIFDDKYSLSASKLNELFNHRGICFNPNTYELLSISEIEQLENLVFLNNDNNLLKTINSLKYKTPPSPIQNIIYDDDNLFIKTHIDHFKNNPEKTCDVMTDILYIGLYLSGWVDKTPFITNIKNVPIVNVELKIYPLIEKLSNNVIYDFIKHFPIINYMVQNDQYIPNIQDIDVTILQIITDIINNKTDSSKLLITTSYYYLTNICNSSLSQLDPLIINISQN